MSRYSFDIYFGETLCGTAWARSIDGGDEKPFCIETCLKYRDVREIGLHRARTKARYQFSKEGRPRKIELSGDNGASVEINISDGALSYGKKDTPLDKPIDFALGNNMIPLLAIWWKEFKVNRPGTFKTLLPETGAIIDYTLEGRRGSLRSSLGEEFILDDEGDILEVRPEASDFVIRRSNRPFPNWVFRPKSKQNTYQPPKDLNIQDVEIKEGDKVIEATVARPFDGPLAAVGIFIGGTGIFGRHGITETIDIGTHQLLDDLAREGVASVRYEKIDRNASNLVEAEGAIDFETLCVDGERWLNWLEHQSWTEGLPRILIGHSMGGVIALALSARHPEISACVLLNTPGRPLSEVIESQSAWNEEHAPSSKEAQVEARRMREALQEALALDVEWNEDNVDPKLLPMKHKRKFLKSVIGLDPCGFVNQAECPLVIVRGTVDVQVFAEDADLLLAAANQAKRPVKFLKAEGLDHLLKHNQKTGREALAAYRDRRRRIPISLIRRIAGTVRDVLEKSS